MKSKRILAIVGVLALVLAGTAWAVTIDTFTPLTPNGVVTALTGTVNVDYAIPYTFTNVQFGGNATLVGSILRGSNNVTPTDVRVRLFAGEGDTFALRPLGGGAGKMYGVVPTVVASTTQTPNLNDQLRTVINAADTDHLPSLSTGTVLVAGANGNQPIWATDATGIYNTGRYGTFVEHGTFAVTHRNSLGLAGVVLVGDTGVEPVLTIRDTNAIMFGQYETGGQLANQPLVFARNIVRDEPATAVKGVVDIGKTGSVPQELYFVDGAWQSLGATGAAVLTAGNGEFNQGYATFAYISGSSGTVRSDGTDFVANSTYPNAASLVANAAGDPRPGWPLGITASARPFYFATLVKRGGGDLIIGSDSTKNPITQASANQGTATGSYPGAAYFGGTEVEGGLVKVDGGTANTDIDRYKGALGATWQKNTLNTYFANTVFVTGSLNNNDSATATAATPYIYDTGTDSTGDATPGAANANGVKALHNPLTLTNDGSVIVNRSQVFTFFRGTEDTSFEAKEFIQDGESLRPEVHVRLAKQHSNFSGKLTGSFDLVLDSMETRSLLNANSTSNPSNPTFYNRPGADVNHIAQARLTLDNTDNNIYGRTLIADGVLAVAGQGSIGQGIGLQVGETNGGSGTNAVARTEAGSVATFVGISSDKFTIPVRVESIKNNVLVAPSNALFDRNGALAAERDAVTTYADVTIDGGVEINPRAVHSIHAGIAAVPLWSGETNTLDTWLGTVRFGVSPDVYAFTGTTLDHTRILISNGTLFLGGYPVGVGGTKPFGEIFIRQDAGLSLEDGVNDFSDTLDVAVEDNSRIRVYVTEDDVVSSRLAALQQDALFEARSINYSYLGTGDNNTDKRLTIQLDLSKLPVQHSLNAGSWIKVITSAIAPDFDNLHRRTPTGTGAYEDYKKVRIVDQDFRDLEDWAVADLDINTHSILVNVIKDFEREPVDPDQPSPNFTFEGTSTATADLISGTVKLVDDAGAPVVSTDVTVELFRTGVEQTSANALVTEITTTDETNGVAAYDFEPSDANLTAFEAGVTYVVRASAEGYTAATKSVTIPGGAPITGSSSSGCDAGFGVFALLAATGAVTLLRKKD
jgi:Synergist-CTERM protein sorting domain-containing protein